ncbi:MAG: oligosaccharide flippase family protein [Candidatus Scalindua sp.]|nr:oligosaccharide flippase family protein [Candidatus Scalindua sp.]
MVNMGVKKAIFTCCPSVVHPFLNRIKASDVGSRLARGVFWSMAGAVISRGLMLAASVLVARMLGKTGYGELGMIQSTVGMFGVFAGFGLGLTATKHVAEFFRSDPERAGRIIGLSGLVAMVTGGLMAMGLFVFAPWLAEHTINAPHLAGVLRIGAVILFISALNGAQTGALSGFEAFKTIAYVNLFVGLISFPILVCGAYFGGLTGAVWALAINLGFNWLFNHLALRKEAHRYRVLFTFRKCSRELSILWRFSLPAVLSGTMVGPVFWICKSMLANQQDGYSELGVYAAAEHWQALVYFASGIIAQAAFPVLSQLYGDGQRQLFKKTLLTQIYLNGAIVLSGAVVISILSKPIMTTYGPEFSGNTLVLITVMLGCIPMQLAGIVGVVNKCVGNIWWGVLLNALWATAILLATSALVRYGALGLAWAFFIAYCFHFATTTIYVLCVFRTSPKLRMERSL